MSKDDQSDKQNRKRLDENVRTAYGSYIPTAEDQAPPTTPNEGDEDEDEEKSE